MFGKLPLDIKESIGDILTPQEIRNLLLTGASINREFRPVYQDYLQYINDVSKPTKLLNSMSQRMCTETYLARERDDLIAVGSSVAKVLNLPQQMKIRYGHFIGSYLYSLKCLELWVKIYITQNSLLFDMENVQVDSVLSLIFGVNSGVYDYDYLFEQRFKDRFKIFNPMIEIKFITREQLDFLCQEYDDLLS